MIKFASSEPSCRTRERVKMLRILNQLLYWVDSELPIMVRSRRNPTSSLVPASKVCRRMSPVHKMGRWKARNRCRRWITSEATYPDGCWRQRSLTGYDVYPIIVRQLVSYSANYTEERSRSVADVTIPNPNPNSSVESVKAGLSFQGRLIPLDGEPDGVSLMRGHTGEVGS